MFIKKIMPFALLAFAGVLPFSIQTFAMGAKPDTPAKQVEALRVPESQITLKELAAIYWPDSNATQVQQEEILKNLLGKKVNWEITVAQIQRNGSGYLIQGQSDKDELGTFSYIVPENQKENDKILKASMGSQLKISGIVKDMQMRHIVLDPAHVTVK